MSHREPQILCIQCADFCGQMIIKREKKWRNEITEKKEDKLKKWLNISKDLEAKM